jgi:glutamate-1-semialdehyde 2,1-aminomutase
MHLYALNRGVLLTPFHNMALMSPATRAADVDRHTRVFREAVGELTSSAAGRASARLKEAAR